jgi:monoamine oxidase
MPGQFDVVILGAGAAGLSAAVELASAGKLVTILEARDRIGGRMFTRHDLTSPVELGAEFIHGFAPEIFGPLQQHGITIEEVHGQTWSQRNGELCACDFFEETDKILAGMTDDGPDEPFAAWLERKFPNPENDPRLAEAKSNALRFVVGFNAADANLVSVHWLVHNARADEKIQGERAFRMAGGYATLIALFAKQLKTADVSIQLNTVAEAIRWSRDGVRIAARRDDKLHEVHARSVLVTLPLGVLQAKPGEAGAVLFDPPLPSRKQDALGKLMMGKVMRVTLRFRGRFWEHIHPAGCKDSLANLGFLLSEDERFPTWWTHMTQTAPIITGWAPAHYAEKLSGESEFFLMDESLASLSSIFHIEKAELEKQVEAFYCHDWQTDPFSRGAYSYSKVGGEGAQGMLGAPVDGILFFAGEATDVTGHNGTVHGAIASGKRAAKEILSGSAQLFPNG